MVLQHRRTPLSNSSRMLLLPTINFNNSMSPTRLKKILVSCYLDRSQLDQLKEMSERTGAPMTHYMREGIALVLDKYHATKGTKKRRIRTTVD
jgi:hypothetical protein